MPSMAVKRDMVTDARKGFDRLILTGSMSRPVSLVSGVGSWQPFPIWAVVTWVHPDLSRQHARVSTRTSVQLGEY